MESNPNIKTWTPATIVMVALIIAGSVVALYRMINGLGAATNLNDGYPWGFWLGLDVLGGIAMVAIGASTVNILLVVAGLALIGVAVAYAYQSGMMQDWADIIDSWKE